VVDATTYHLGQVCAALSKNQGDLPRSGPVIAEAMGALCAMEFYLDLDMRDIIFEGDYKQVVVQVINQTGT
jgi:hypothetical protein